jgi:hypothetical protein
MITVTVSASCLRCPWAAGSGDWAAVDRAARRHTAPGHPTVTEAKPSGEWPVPRSRETSTGQAAQ